MKIELKVRRHPAGTLTLTKKMTGDPLATDIHEPCLFVNPNGESFYKAVAARLARLNEGGQHFTYQDVES